MGGNNNQLIKIANKYLIMDSLRASELVTMDEVVNKTKLSYPTVRTIMQKLVEEGLVLNAGQAVSAGGRQPALFRLNTGSYYAIGIDFAVPCIRIAVSNLKGKIIHSSVEYYDENESEQTIMDYLTELCNRTIAEVGVPKDQYIGLGIGLPGIIDLRSNSSILMERMSQSDKRIDIAENLEKAIGIHVYIRNDVHLLGLVEKYLYVDKREKNFLYIALRSGVGMAIFKNGKLMEGNMGNAGYIGHTMIDCNGRQCVCGKRGCLEIMVNSDYLIEEYNAIRKAAGLPHKTVECKDWAYLETFSKLAEKGDPAAIDVVRIAGKALGCGVSNVIKILDFTSVIFGGFPKECQNLLLESVEQSIRENIHRYIMKEVKLDKGKLNFNMAALGGCFLAIDNFFMGPKLKLVI